MERNYVLSGTGEKVKLGDVIAYEYEKKSSLGIIRIEKSYKLTADNVDFFIEHGIIKQCEELKEASDNIGFYITMLANEMQCNPEDLVEYLEKMNEVCPKAVLDILLNSISNKFYNDDPEAFDRAECYYSLRPKDGKVGRVVNINPHISLFASKEDAEIARSILKEQLDYMYGEGC